MCSLKNSDIYKNILKNRLPRIALSMSDFKYGTYLIERSGYYYLTEDIVFIPNKYYRSKGGRDFLPTPEQRKGKYSHSSFILGFYSAININTSNVIIDLNGYSISQHKLYCLQQRFFQVIQLNNSPFIFGQGPSGTFAKDGFIKTENIVIKNGTIGLTSHYCIHGNDNKNVLIENLTCKHFESGGIALNNVDNLVMSNVKIKNNRLDTPVLATYSILRSLKIIFNQCPEDLLGNVNFNFGSASYMFKKLLKLENRIYSNYIKSRYKTILNKDKNDNLEKEIRNFFYNQKGLSDGSSLVGCQITPKGVAINAFEKQTHPCCPFSSTNTNDKNNKEERKSSNIVFNNVSIKNLIAEPKEIIQMENNGNPVIGCFGDRVDILNIMNTDNTYKKSIINDCLCCIARISDIVERNENLNIITTIKIPEWMIQWADSSNESIFNYNRGENISLVYGQDIMGHFNKGCLGLRIGGTNNIEMNNLNIKNVYNIGKDTLYNKTFKEIENKKIEKTNVEDETGNVYSGILSIGMIVSNCKNIKGRNIYINNIKSKHQTNHEIIYNDSEKINQ
jgi:hypothetical protein